MRTRDQILADNPIVPFLESRGVKIRGNGPRRTATRCAWADHKEQHWCVTIEVGENLFHCNDCKRGGTIIDWLMAERNASAGDVLNSFNEPKPAAPSAVKPRIAALYDYRDESGQLVYQAVRLEPKGFRQRRPIEGGKWAWDMEGVTRILFNLAAVLTSQVICICEGEKDCLNLGAFDYVTTCNVGGAGKWLPAYSENFKQKDAIVFPDNDEPGRKHAADIIKSLDGIANSAKLVIIPPPYKDVSDFIASFPEKETARREIVALIDKTAHAIKPMPIYSIAEMEAAYRADAQRTDRERFDLGNFLPDLGRTIAPMVPGEVLLLLADTGVGKTMILQNLLKCAAPLPSLFFELELPQPLVFERLVQMHIGARREEVQAEYKTGDIANWKFLTSLHHIMVCPEAGLSVEQIEKLVVRSELKFGRRPALVAIDYVGLVNHQGSRSRYEALSNIAEQIKVMAKRTQTIVLMASQIARPDKKAGITIGLHDAKDSGALENSAGIVIGAWRPERHELRLKILKNTSGQSGGEFAAYFDGAKMRISPNVT